MKRILCLIVSLCFLVPFFSCGAFSVPLKVLSGSENRAIEGLLKDFAEKNNINLSIDYRGSVEIMQELQGETTYDAVWPAHSIWVDLAGNKKVKTGESIMYMPVVLGVRLSKARELGYVDKKIPLKQIVEDVKGGKLRLAITRSSQSNSGLMALIAFLTNLSGSDILTTEAFNDMKLRQDAKALMSGVNQTSPSSDDLKEAFLTGEMDAMINYEALLIDANQKLVEQGREPLYVVDLDGVVGVADSPFTYVDQGDANKQKAFKSLEGYLTSDEVKKTLVAMGRRVPGFGGKVENPPLHLFNPAWGIHVDRPIVAMRIPSEQTVLEAINLYQSEFRKPSFIVFCLDYSGSMDGNGGIEGLKSAMRTILDYATASKYFLQFSPHDVIVVIPFNDKIITTYRYRGVPTDLSGLLAELEQRPAGGGTNIFDPAIQAATIIANEPNIENYLPSIVFMTDGDHRDGTQTYAHVERAWRTAQDRLNAYRLRLPIFSIAFGKDIRSSYMEDMAKLSGGLYFNEKEQAAKLVDFFKKIRGYN